MSNPEPPPPSPSSILRGYLELVRLPNIFTAMADVMMGFLFTHAVFLPGEDGWVLGLLLAASSLLYAAGVVLNDVCDFEVDCVERPGRPLPSGRVSRTAARWLGWELLIVGVALAWLAGFLANDFRPGIVALVLAGCVVGYDRWLKRTPAGPLGMGGCRMLNVLLGMSLLIGSWQAAHWLIAASVGIYIAGVTWFARNESGTSSRRQLGLAMVVVLLGVGLLAWLPDWTGRLFDVRHTTPDRFRLAIGVLGLLIGFRFLRAVMEPGPYRVQMAVKQGILSLVVLNAAVCFLAQGLFGAAAVLVLLIPAVVFGRWIYST